MNAQKNDVFNIDDKKREELDLRMVMDLFKIMYSQNKITKKEYDALITNACRTFNKNKKIC